MMYKEWNEFISLSFHLQQVSHPQAHVTTEELRKFGFPASWLGKELLQSPDYNDNETPTVRGLAANNNNKLFHGNLWNNHYNLWNNHYNLNFSDNSIRNEDEKHDNHQYHA